MARRVALIPEELISSHQYQNIELRLEDEIAALLDRKKIPDDMKAKLLGQLVMRYQKAVHTPPEPVPVSIKNDGISDKEKEKLFQSNQDIVEKKEESVQEKFYNGDNNDNIIKDIITSTPHRFQKFVYPIVEKLKTRNYFWNSRGEMIVGNETVEGSSIVDFFNYLFRNVKSLTEPSHFQLFLKALSEINIPRTWIANKTVLAALQTRKPSAESVQDVFPSEDVSEPYKESDISPVVKRGREFGRRRRELKSHSVYPKSSDVNKWKRSRSHSPMQKWLEY